MCNWQTQIEKQGLELQFLWNTRLYSKVVCFINKAIRVTPESYILPSEEMTGKFQVGCLMKGKYESS